MSDYTPQSRYWITLDEANISTLAYEDEGKAREYCAKLKFYGHRVNMFKLTRWYRTVERRKKDATPPETKEDLEV
jgi:hypothetical protein